uniref:Ig-like domain-containing protein n=1 Tax=Mola mola TaxID=94237 RepID=A0A3Q3WRN9_MOLML
MDCYTMLCLMILTFQILSAFVFLHTGASQTNSVLQKPPFIIKRADESVVSGIYCSHKMTGHDRILWYKQDEHKALKLLGYLNVNFPNPEDHVKGKISFDGDGRTHSSLSISNLSLSDSGVYFCAASHHNRRSTCSCYSFCLGSSVITFTVQA